MDLTTKMFGSARADGSERAGGVKILILDGVSLVIWCTACGGERGARKEHVCERGGRMRWYNLCSSCGATYPALPPKAAQVRGDRRRLERAGQLALALGAGGCVRPTGDALLLGALLCAFWIVLLVEAWRRDRRAQGGR